MSSCRIVAKNDGKIVILIVCSDLFLELPSIGLASKWGIHNKGYTVELGDKELFGHPKIVP